MLGDVEGGGGFYNQKLILLEIIEKHLVSSASGYDQLVPFLKAEVAVLRDDFPLAMMNEDVFMHPGIAEESLGVIFSDVGGGHDAVTIFQELDPGGHE